MASNIVYLDTSHLHLLARAREEGRPAYAAFLEAWRARHCEIVFSMFHILELRRHQDPAIRRTRYRLLQDLVPIRLDIAWPNPDENGPKTMLEREILRAYIAKGMVSASTQEAADIMTGWAEILPGRLVSAAEAVLAQITEAGVFGWASELAFSALTAAAAARARPADQPYQSPRLKDIPAESPGADEFKRMLDLVHEATPNQDRLWDDLGRFFPPEAMAAFRFAIALMMRETLKKQAALGPRQVFADALGIDPTGKALNARLDDLQFDWTFREVVDGVVRRFFPIEDPEEHSAAVSALQVADCPGKWLRNAVETDLNRATPAPEPGDHYDLDHVAYLPYVDLLTADKRIVDFCRRVMTRKDCLASLRNVRPPVRAATVDGLRQAVERLAL